MLKLVMNVRLDQNVPVVVADWLRGQHPDWDIRHVNELGFEGKSDEFLYQWAQAKQAIVITYDEDFADARCYPLGHHHGVIRLRVWPTERHFCSGVPEPKIPRRFLGGMQEEGGAPTSLAKAILLLIFSLLSPFMAPRNRCGIFNSGTPEFKIPQHLHGIRHSLCLRVSSRTRRVVNLDFRYYLVAGLIYCSKFSGICSAHGGPPDSAF
jgi:predicted nuclease of predicted toxin-antitoxin system